MVLPALTLVAGTEDSAATAAGVMLTAPARLGPGIADVATTVTASMVAFCCVIGSGTLATAGTTDAVTEVSNPGRITSPSASTRTAVTSELADGVGARTLVIAATTAEETSVLADRVGAGTDAPGAATSTATTVLLADAVAPGTLAVVTTRKGEMTRSGRGWAATATTVAASCRLLALTVGVGTAAVAATGAFG